MKDKHPIDKYFKEQLEGHTTKPSAAVWEKIEQETVTGQKSALGLYLMRAAVVVLMLGVASWLYFQNEPQDLIVASPVEENDTKTESPEKAGTQAAGEKADKEKDTEKTERERKQEKVIPIMRSRSTSQPIYVSREVPMQEVNEELLYEQENAALASMNIDLEDTESEKEETPQVKVKLRLTRPVTQSAFYASADSTEQEDKGVKEKLYAYANDQLTNLINGRPVELPKTSKKPQLEINLDKIFNN